MADRDRRWWCIVATAIVLALGCTSLVTRVLDTFWWTLAGLVIGADFAIIGMRIAYWDKDRRERRG